MDMFYKYRRNDYKYFKEEISLERKSGSWCDFFSANALQAYEHIVEGHKSQYVILKQHLGSLNGVTQATLPCSEKRKNK